MTQAIIERNLAVTQQHIANEGIDPALVMELYTDDVVLEVPGRGLCLASKAEIEANYRRMFASFADVEMIPLDRFANETRVFDDMIVRFTLVGDGMTNAPVAVGSRVELRLLHIFHMRDGRIAREIVHEHWTKLD